MEVRIIKEFALPNILEIFRSSSPVHLALYLCAGTIFLPFPITAAVLLCVVIWAISQKEIRQAMFEQKGIPVLLSFFILLIVVPLCWGSEWGILAGIGAIIVFLFMLYARAVITRESLLISFNICCIASIVPFIYSIIEKLILGFNFRSTAGCLNANYYGEMIEFVVLICVWNLIYNRRRYRLYLLILIMNAIGLLLCDSHSACAAIIISVALMLFLSGHWKAGLIFSAVSAVFVTISVTVPGFLPRFDKMPDTFEKRVRIWESAWNGIKAHPILGQGILTYYFSCGQYEEIYTYHAHSIYLDPLLNYGIVGVSMLVYYFSTVFQKVFQFLHNLEMRRFSILMICASAAILVHGFTDVTILWVQTGMLYFLILSGAGLKASESGES